MKNLKSISTALLAIAFIALSGFTELSTYTPPKAMSWSIDEAHSNISFEVRHFFTPVSGSFKEYASEINFDPENLEESNVNLEIMVSSIDTDNEKRDGHLQSDDFFSAEEYPAITFASEKITEEGENKFIAHGKLTIKNVTKNVELPFELLGIQDHPMKENTMLAGIKIDHTIDRNEYKVGTGSWSETAVVGGDVDISIALELQHDKSGMSE
jgi:polyisoprenoid-binding protein YceI